MAVRALVTDDKGDGVVIYSWTGLLDDTTDTGAPAYVGGAESISLQVLGNFGTGGELTLQGSNDGGTTYAPVSTAINAAGISAVTVNTEIIRPAITDGSGAVDLDCYVKIVRRR